MVTDAGRPSPGRAPARRRPGRRAANDRRAAGPPGSAPASSEPPDRRPEVRRLRQSNVSSGSPKSRRRASGPRRGRARAADPGRAPRCRPPSGRSGRSGPGSSSRAATRRSAASASAASPACCAAVRRPDRRSIHHRSLADAAHPPVCRRGSGRRRSSRASGPRRSSARCRAGVRRCAGSIEARPPHDCGRRPLTGDHLAMHGGLVRGHVAERLAGNRRGLTVEQGTWRSGSLATAAGLLTVSSTVRAVRPVRGDVTRRLRTEHPMCNPADFARPIGPFVHGSGRRDEVAAGSSAHSNVGRSSERGASI